MKKNDKIIRTGSLMETQSQFQKRQSQKRRKEQGKFLLKVGVLISLLACIYKKLD